MVNGIAAMVAPTATVDRRRVAGDRRRERDRGFALGIRKADTSLWPLRPTAPARPGRVLRGRNKDRRGYFVEAPRKRPHRRVSKSTGTNHQKSIVGGVENQDVPTARAASPSAPNVAAILSR